MTLAEFLAPLKKATQRDKCLGALYYKQRYENLVALTADEIRLALRNARVPALGKINVPDVLSKSGHYVDSPGSRDGKRLWSLTNSGESYVRDVFGLPSAEPEIEHNVGALTGLVSKVTDKDVQQYIEESIKCLQVNALRAAIVFLWTGAIRTIQEKALLAGTLRVNAAIAKHDPKARAVTKLDDFAYIKDKIFLLAAFDLGVLDKGERDTLQEGLDLRNRCGHPTKYRPGVAKASSFVEDVVGIAFSAAP